MKDWIEKEYKRLKVIQIKKDNEVLIINGDKHIKRRDLTNFFTDSEIEDLKLENEIPFNVGKDFHEEWNKEDKWSEIDGWSKRI